MKQPTQRDFQAETRRSQLLDIALNLFAERGVENVSMKDLAREANVAQGLIYHYFQSKDDLLVAVFQRYNPLEEFKAIIARLSGLPAQEGLALFASQLAELMAEKRLVLRLLVRELLSPRSSLLAEVLAFRAEVIGMLTAYFESRIAAGELKPHQPLISIHMLFSSLMVLLLLDQPLEPYVTQFVEMILEGIRVP
jgi:TetR/AcrR family transcriptional regulator, cholesterol catabolism regulator